MKTMVRHRRLDGSRAAWATCEAPSEPARALPAQVSVEERTSGRGRWRPGVVALTSVARQGWPGTTRGRGAVPPRLSEETTPRLGVPPPKHVPLLMLAMTSVYAAAMTSVHTAVNTEGGL
jgi:hypothetical protein